MKFSLKVPDASLGAAIIFLNNSRVVLEAVDHSEVETVLRGDFPGTAASITEAIAKFVEERGLSATFELKI